MEGKVHTNDGYFSVIGFNHAALQCIVSADNMEHSMYKFMSIIHWLELLMNNKNDKNAVRPLWPIGLYIHTYTYTYKWH